jgi:hypothetical protein
MEHELWKNSDEVEGRLREDYRQYPQNSRAHPVSRHRIPAYDAAPFLRSGVLPHTEFDDSAYRHAVVQSIQRSRTSGADWVSRHRISPCNASSTHPAPTVFWRRPGFTTACTAMHRYVVACGGMWRQIYHYLVTTRNHRPFPLSPFPLFP